MGKDELPPASWFQRNPPRRQLFFLFLVANRAPMLRHTNPDCWGGTGEVAVLQRDTGKLYSQRENEPDIIWG